MTNKLRLVIMAICALGLLAIIMTSCQSRSGRLREVKKKNSYNPVPTRVKILENGTISYVFLSEVEQAAYRPLDTVWVNLSTHKVDDISDTTMKGILLLTITQ